MKNYNAKLIAKNVGDVLASGDIERLSKTSYDFLYLMGGFIAHYNLYGFQDYYTDTEKLRSDILNSMDISDKDRYINDGFFSKGKDAEYYKSKYDVLVELEKVCKTEEVPVKKYEFAIGFMGKEIYTGEWDGVNLATTRMEILENLDLDIFPKGEEDVK
jgi:hypothetical protein